MTPALQDLALMRRVGAIAIAVLVLTIGGLVFLLDRIEIGTPVRIRVMFRHTAGLREHAALVIAGQAIGRVEAISPVLHGERSLLGGEVGVAVIVAIDGASARKVPAGSEIFVASRGPVSERYLEVAPPRGEPGPAVRDGQELRGVDPPSLDSVLQRAWRNLTVFHELSQAVRPEMAALRTEVERLRGELAALDRAAGAAGGAAGLVDAARELVATARQSYEVSLGGAPGLAHLRATLGDARAISGELRAAIDRLAPGVAALRAELVRIRGRVDAGEPLRRAEEAIAKVRAALDTIDPLIADAAVLADRIASGEGSLLRLIRDPEFPEDAKDLGKVVKRHPWRILDHAPKGP